MQVAEDFGVLGELSFLCKCAYTPAVSVPVVTSSNSPPLYAVFSLTSVLVLLFFVGLTLQHTGGVQCALPDVLLLRL